MLKFAIKHRSIWLVNMHKKQANYKENIYKKTSKQHPSNTLIQKISTNMTTKLMSQNQIRHEYVRVFLPSGVWFGVLRIHHTH